MTASPLGAQSRLYAVLGWFAGEEFGAAVAVLGDLDGDGVAEWMAERGGPRPGSRRPELFVLSGRDGLLLHDIHGQGVVDTIFFLESLADLGDVDLDGVDDFAFGNSSARVNAMANAGRVVVHSGRTGQELYVVNGVLSGGAFGASLASIGDVDLDGRPDFVVGQIGGMDENAWVVSGATGTMLFRVHGPPGNDPEFGYVVAPTGDLDLDGTPDFAVGSHSLRRVRFYSGASGALLRSLNGGRSFGRHLADLGDVDGDGFRDLLIDEAGRHVVAIASGRTGESLAAVPIPAGVDSLAAAGDVDGDGADDFLVGDGSAGAGTGVVMLYSTRTLKVLAKVVGQRAGDRFGDSVAGGADFDADGRLDFVVGAPGADGFARGGAAGEASIWSFGAAR